MLILLIMPEPLKVMYLRSLPTHSGPPTATIGRITKANTLTSWQTAPLVNPETPPDLFPADEIDPTFDRDALIASQPIPEVSPVFTGVRRYIAELRLNRAQNKIEQLAEDEQVLRFVGKSTLKWNGFRAIEEPNRPKTLKQNTAAQLLNATYTRARLRRARTNNIARNYNHVDQANSRLRERMTDRKMDRFEVRLHRQASRRHKLFKHIIARPGRKANKLIKRRDKLALKAHALE
jgi:hypothetical protein